ncbi:MAG: hypothetical protein ACHQ0Y_15230 [Thermodesulfovibrionales bacterium]
MKALNIIMPLCAILIVGCVTTPKDPHLQAIEALGNPVYSLSAAVDVVADRLPADTGDSAILSAATAKDPSLLAPFAGYTVKARIEGKAGVILICDKDGKHAYIEDVSCTPQVDTWRPTGSPCVFFLDVKKVCR